MNIRFRYIPFKDLSLVDQESVKRAYAGIAATIKRGHRISDDEYQYPITKTGKLARASRWISLEKATELHNIYIAREVMES